MSFESEFNGHWRSRKPHAGVGKHVVGRMSREAALAFPYIEGNPHALRSLIITDHDGVEADRIAELKGLPEPSYVAQNPFTGAGHIVYALADPVCLTDSARRKPMNFLARIESGLTTVLEGDPGYTGPLTKNPFHQQHLPLWGPDTAVYSLRELADGLRELKALPDYKPKRTLTNSGVGRNCWLFDDLRHWAYPRRTSFARADEWEEAVLQRALDRNADRVGEFFTRGPLAAVEVGYIARSVARWTWRNLTPAQEAKKRREWGARMGKASAEKHRIDRDAIRSVSL